MAIIYTSALLEEFTNQFVKDFPELPEYCAVEGLNGWLEAPFRVDKNLWLAESITDMLFLEEECYDINESQINSEIIKSFGKSFRKVTGANLDNWYESGISFICDHKR